MLSSRLLLPLGLLLAFFSTAQARVDDDLYEEVRPGRYDPAERMTKAQKAEIKADRKEASRLRALRVKEAQGIYKISRAALRSGPPRALEAAKARLAWEVHRAKSDPFALVVISHEHELQRAGMAFDQVPEISEILDDMKDRAEMLEDLYASLVTMTPDQREAAIAAWNGLPQLNDEAHAAFVASLGQLHAELYRSRVEMAHLLMGTSRLSLASSRLADLAALDDGAYAAAVAARAATDAAIQALPADARPWRRREVEMAEVVDALEDVIANW